MVQPRLYARVTPSGQMSRTGKIIVGPRQTILTCKVVDYSAGGTRQRPPLVVLRAGADELAEHARVLGEIARESKGRCLWRDLENAPGMG